MLTKQEIKSLLKSHSSEVSALNALVQLAGETTTASSLFTSAHTVIVSSLIAVELSPENPNRKSVEIANNSTSILYVKKGTLVSPTVFTYKLFPDDMVIIDDSVEVITGVWDVANGDAQVTETTN
jgi:hypothetical protein